MMSLAEKPVININGLLSQLSEVIQMAGYSSFACHYSHGRPLIIIIIIIIILVD